jgi:ubiquinone/menaquinone biosynthesis C-methylase UbiE
VRLSYKRFSRVLLALLLVSTFTLHAQSAATTTQRATSKPYTGDLSIFEYPDRDQKLQVNRVMDILGLKAGSTVADIGAGSGWFTLRAAKRVGPSGLVYAVDINPEAISYINDRAKREHLENIRAIRGHEDDPLLPDNSIDSVLLLKTYHEVAQPVRLLQKLRQALKPGALVGVIDRDGKGDDHGVDRKIVIDEARTAGFKLVSTYDFVKPDHEDYFLVLESTQ